ncbi:hypothetical protein HAX54_010587 [Datura stramonium]|uniref:Uncharacterized protein n=1 Tax=Datura stramonium TaxID=4076 RepID=A0ABS8TGK6_DATST|nr:hypothetical protein [Datura stramonium]
MASPLLSPCNIACHLKMPMQELMLDTHLSPRVCNSVMIKVVVILLVNAFHDFKKESAIWYVDNKNCDIEAPEPAQGCEGNTINPEHQTETRLPDSNDLQLEEVQYVVDTLPGECSKLSEEPVLTYISHGEVGCRVDNLQINMESHYCLDVNVLQGNGK